MNKPWHINDKNMTEVCSIWLQRTIVNRLSYMPGHAITRKRIYMYVYVKPLQETRAHGSPKTLGNRIAREKRKAGGALPEATERS